MLDSVMRGESVTVTRQGKPGARAYDALIAATAVANDLPVFTRNPDDFAGIESLTVVTLNAGP